jgi:hypothetical protein
MKGGFFLGGRGGNRCPALSRPSQEELVSMIDGCGFNVDQDVTAWRLSRSGDIPDFKLTIVCSANRLHCFSSYSVFPPGTSLCVSRQLAKCGLVGDDGNWFFAAITVWD